MQRTEQPEMFFVAKRKIFQNAYDLRHKIPASQKTPYTNQELIDALDHGL